MADGWQLAKSPAEDSEQKASIYFKFRPLPPVVDGVGLKSSLLLNEVHDSGIFSGKLIALSAIRFYEFKPQFHCLYSVFCTGVAQESKMRHWQLC